MHAAVGFQSPTNATPKILSKRFIIPSSHRKQVVDPLAATSWSRGRLVFRATPLARAVEEVNRYAAKKLRIAAPSLAGLSVSGNFVAGNSELAASAFAAVLPIHVVDGGSEITLSPGRADSSP